MGYRDRCFFPVNGSSVPFSTHSLHRILQFRSMEPTPPSTGDTYSPDISSFDSLPETGAPSFTAFLGLVPSVAVESVAVELLHDSVNPPEIPPSSGGDVWRLPVPLGCSITFPSYVALVDRAARLSVFAADDSPKVEGTPSARLKAEQADSCDRLVGRSHRLTGKRKGGGGGGSKMNMSKTGGEEEEEEKKKCTGGDEKPLPYVHVRARRGQATDSHSLTERARREKINARMKLLQELVPGCNKIPGTALVLDKIINHVQSLQRQVEFLSMQLAAVNPRVDFSSLDTILSAELMEGDRRNAMGLEQSSPWSTTDGTTNGDRQQQQQLWHVDLVQQQEQLQQWERDEAENPHHQLQHHGFLEQPGSSPFPT